ncbi:MAG: hypothetical protein WC551_09480 [Patescibacteria group bacterium]
MDVSVNAPIKQKRTISEWVWFEGATALLEGQGVCYNWDYGTATAADYRRCNRVELPTILNARYFAGVAARNYSAKAGGQFIEIYKPGSCCTILSKASTTIGVGILTCEAGGTYAGYFRYAGLPGDGSAVPLQTVDRSATAGACEAILQAGEPSGLLDVVTLTADGGAVACMVGGTTVFAGVALVAADGTFTVANGTIPGMRKRFVCLADLGDAHDMIVTVNGIQVDGSTALQTVVLDDINDEDTIEWTGDWYEKGRVGASVT